MPPSRLTDGPGRTDYDGGCMAVFAFWLLVGVIAGIVTLIQVLF